MRCLVAVGLVAASVAVVGTAPARAAGAITVTPHTGLNDGDVLTISATGWVPKSTVGVCEGVPSSPPDINACNSNVSPHLFTADASGNFTVTFQVQRFIFAPLVGKVDCAAPTQPCILGAAQSTDIANTTVTVPLQFVVQPPQIQLGGVDKPEGDSGLNPFVFPVTLSYPSTQTVTVQWNTLPPSQTPSCFAEPGTDYVAGSGTVTFTPGVTSQSITVNVIGDTVDEANECFIVLFHDAVNAVLASPGRTEGLIENDDEPLQVIPGQGSVVEGNSGTTLLPVSVSLTKPAGQPFTVQWHTVCICVGSGIEADPNTDYTPMSGTVSFTAQQIRSSAVITVNGDTLVEPDEWIVVQFTNPSSGTIGGYGGLGFGEIINDDHATIVPNGGSVVKPTTGTATLPISVSLSNPSTHTITAQWNTVFLTGASDVQATPDTDYTPASGTVTFAPGETTQTVPIEVKSGVLADPYKIFVVSFHNPVNATMGGYYGFAFGFILGNTEAARQTTLDPSTLPARAIAALGLGNARPR